jgi:allantoinase
MDRLKGFGKINPPLRSDTELALLWEYIRKGYIDIVASDDAAWASNTKTKPRIFDNSSGVPGVQTIVSLLYSEGVSKGRISLFNLVRLLSEGPAKVFQLWPQKGSLMPGSYADITIIDPRVEWEIRDEDMLSYNKWSPYTGMNLRGRVETTIVRGTVVYRDGKIVGQAGYGKFVPANRS